MVVGAVESISLLIVSMLFFVIIGLRTNAIRAPNEEYWQANSEISAEDTSKTWSAGSISLSLTILYYMSATTIFGWKILIISILTYLIGQFVFVRAALRWRQNNSFLVASVGLILQRAGIGRSLTVLAQISGLFSLFAMLYIELVFSVEIISIIVGGVRSNGTVFLLFIASTFVVSAYILAGGMRAVVMSDLWQLMLVYIAVAILSLLGILLLVRGAAIDYSSPLPWYSSNFRETDSVSLIAFGLAANILPLLCQNQLWQVVSVSRTRGKELWRALRFGIVRAFIIFCLVIFVAFIIRGDGRPANFDTLAFYLRELGEVGALFLLPMLFVGLLAAMFSTADGLMLGISYTAKNLLDQSAWRWWSELPMVRSRILLIIGFSAAQIFLYATVTFVFQISFDRYFLALIFFLFSQGAPFGVVVAMAIFFPNYLCRTGRLTVIVALVWLADFAAFLASIILEIQKIQLLATPLLILVTAACSLSFFNAK